jgi:hypothetical protein
MPTYDDDEEEEEDDDEVTYSLRNPPFLDKCRRMLTYADVC